MRGNHLVRHLLPCLMIGVVMACLFVRGADADVVSFSGTVSYSGSHAADSLYVAVIDTNTAGDDVSFIVAEAFAVGAPPFSVPFDLSFDNALASGPVILAAALDVDGGGLQTIGGGDIVGWYASTPDPALLSAATSHAGLDFFLPRAEIQGTVTLVPDQLYTQVAATSGPTCLGDHFGPMPEPTASGPYVILGLYAGEYCVGGNGFSMSAGWFRLCYGDPLCTNPTLVTLTASQVVSGVNLDFGTVAEERMTWGAVKSAYR